MIAPHIAGARIRALELALAAAALVVDLAQEGRVAFASREDLAAVHEAMLEEARRVQTRVRFTLPLPPHAADAVHACSLFTALDYVRLGVACFCDERGRLLGAGTGAAPQRPDFLGRPRGRRWLTR